MNYIRRQCSSGRDREGALVRVPLLQEVGDMPMKSIIVIIQRCRVKRNCVYVGALFWLNLRLGELMCLFLCICVHECMDCRPAWTSTLHVVLRCQNRDPAMVIAVQIPFLVYLCLHDLFAHAHKAQSPPTHEHAQARTLSSNRETQH